MARLALVVDDSMLIRHTVCRFLEERGFDVQSSTNGAEAWALLRDQRPDLIVTDLAMPKMSGSELITAVRGASALAEIPIIVLAARRNARDPHLEERADYVVHKDIDIEEQLSNVLALLFAPAIDGPELEVSAQG